MNNSSECTASRPDVTGNNENTEDLLSKLTDIIPNILQKFCDRNVEFHLPSYVISHSSLLHLNTLCCVSYFLKKMWTQRPQQIFSLLPDPEA